eukprot:JZ551664.1.p2 GENE.JZ551664.1~~JZ551664.1.p2  ORF type:complete len:142 (+),score=24.33 JZ551664.1:149-574(+)
MHTHAHAHAPTCTCTHMHMHPHAHALIPYYLLFISPHPPQDTMERWPQVRKAEHEFIFPYQHTADYVYNTALVYELCVLAYYAKPLLVELQNRDLPENLEPEVERLYTLLSMFYPIGERLVPSTSLLREFIGGGDFDVHHG